MTGRTERTAWESALTTGDLDAVQQFLADGVDIDAKTEHGLLPLHEAVAGQHFELCKLLVGSGAKVSVVDDVVFGMTPLHAAIFCRNEAIMEYLLSVGAQPDFTPPAPRSDYVTPLQYAVEIGYGEAVRILADRFKVDFAQRTLDGKTLTQLASGEPEMKALLKTLKAEQSGKDPVGDLLLNLVDAPEPQAEVAVSRSPGMSM